MEAMIEVLEHELEEAFEVKNKKSLHRYILLVTENIVKKDSYEKEQLKISSEIQNLTEIVKQGFERMDERFEVVDRRFESVDKRFESLQRQMDKRFSQLQWTMGLGFTILAALMGIFNFY